MADTVESRLIARIEHGEPSVRHIVDPAITVKLCRGIKALRRFRDAGHTIENQQITVSLECWIAANEALRAIDGDGV